MFQSTNEWMQASLSPNLSQAILPVYLWSSPTCRCSSSPTSSGNRAQALCMEQAEEPALQAGVWAPESGVKTSCQGFQRWGFDLCDLGCVPQAVRPSGSPPAKWRSWHLPHLRYMLALSPGKGASGGWGGHSCSPPHSASASETRSRDSGRTPAMSPLPTDLIPHGC
jgi:hypothetical protein